MKPFKLDEIEKIKTGFKIPEGYFDDFSQELQQKITQSQPERKRYLSQRLRRVISVAALLIAALGIALIQYTKAPKTDVTDESIENYLATDAPLSNDDWANLLDEKDLQKMELNLQLNHQEIEDLLSSDENFEKYLLD